MKAGFRRPDATLALQPQPQPQPPSPPPQSLVLVPVGGTEEDTIPEATRLVRLRVMSPLASMPKGRRCGTYLTPEDGVVVRV